MRKNFQTYKSIRRKIKKQTLGGGLINTLIDKLPIELHLPGYNYCGPGTKLEQRLQRNDRGINPLDEACKFHDLAYSQSSDISKRHEADRLLDSRALERFRAGDSSFGEKLAALGVSSAMKTKLKLGMGCFNSIKKNRSNKKNKKQQTTKKGAGVTFQKAIKNARLALTKHKPKDINSAVNVALRAVKRLKNIKQPRIIPIPKTGGFLPLIPLFAGLSALGALAGGASSIASAVNKAKAAQEELREKQRHNEKMESIAMGKGLIIKPYKKGLGLFVNPYSYYTNKTNFS